MTSQPRRYRVGPFVVDPLALRRENGHKLRIGRRLLALFYALAVRTAEAPDAFASIRELRRDVWPKAVSENAVETAVSRLQKKLHSLAPELTDEWITRMEGNTGYNPDDGYRLVVPTYELSPDSDLSENDNEVSWLPPLARIDCYRIGDDDAALRYELEHFPALIRLRDVHVRVDPSSRKYSGDSLDKWCQGLAAFLSRADTSLILVGGVSVDSDYMKGVAAAIGGRNFDVHCYRLRHTVPLMNFAILDYASGVSEVLFGWGRHDSEFAEAVFVSRDRGLVAEFSKQYAILTWDRWSHKIPVEDLPLQPRSAKTERSILHDQWDQGRLYDLLSAVERGRDDDKEDLRITTSLFVDFHQMRHALIVLLEKGVRIRILVMNPDNGPLVHARFARRTDGTTPATAATVLSSQIAVLENLPRTMERECRGTIEVRVSDLMPCGFAVHTREWAALGLMPTNASYFEGPMLEAESKTGLWNMLLEDWRVRWDATPRQPSAVREPQP